MDYSNIHIEVLNISPPESLGDGKCCIKYLYRFKSVLPDQDTMNSLAKQLDYKRIFSKEVYGMPEDIDVYAWVTIERLNDYEAMVLLLQNEPDESVVFMYGTRSLPTKIEDIFGMVESIQGDSREMWIKTDRKH
jgi:hypothetical protein